MIVAGFLLGGGPGSLEEGIVGLVLPSLIAQAQAQVHVCLGTIGVWVTGSKAINGRPEIRFRLVEPAPAHEQQAIGIVGPAVPGIAPKGLQVIGIGEVGGVAVLLQMQSGEIQFLVGHDLLRLLGRGHGIGNGLNLLFLRRIGKEHAPGSRVNRQGQGSFGHVHGYACLQYLHRAQVAHMVVQGDSVSGKYHPRLGEGLGSVDLDLRLALGHLQPQDALPAGVFHILTMMRSRWSSL